MSSEMDTAESRSRYDDSFKRKAVASLASGNKTARELSEELGIDPSMLSRWKNRYGCESFESVSGNPTYEVTELRLEVETLRSDVSTLRGIVCRILAERHNL